MKIWIGVENFAKIKTAKICVDKYTLLVGPNNCGKTYLMQLINGVNDSWNMLVDRNVEETWKDESTKGCKKYVLSQENIEKFEEELNKKLYKEKEEIVKRTFEKNIPVDNLYIDFLLEQEEKYVIYQTADVSKIPKILREKVDDKPVWDMLKSVRDYYVEIITRVKKNSQEIIWASVYGEKKQSRDYIADEIIALLQERSIFMPSSRSGLMLLYREFFAHKTDNAILNLNKMKGLNSNSENTMNLTQPLYRFLRFLQTYGESEYARERFKEELKFFDSKIIEGHITETQQGFLYESEQGGEVVPMYLTSAMVNEVAPLYLALTSANLYTRITIDEIEASLHPEKQREMVRFMNRIYNKGLKIIVSTHSDTFVSRLNNLVNLAEYVERTEDEDACKKIGVESSDLISSKNLFVYEFVKQENGKSVVEERKFHKGLGYQFDLFTDSALEIYNEAVKLGEIMSHE
ncbi:AAA family ATPase [Blautia sp.]